MRNLLKSNYWLVLLLVLTFSVAAQEQNSGKVEDFKLDSKLMSRQMPYRVILPVSYNQNEQKKYPVIYLLHGLTGHYNNWTENTKLVEYLKPYNFIVVNVEGNNGWYTDSGSVQNDKYESYIIQELIPEIDKKFRTEAKREARVIAGLSMGGYGSLKFGLKYPDKFILVGSFSGALNAASWDFNILGGTWKELTESIVGVYGNMESQTRIDNNIYKLASEASPENIASLPFIYLDCGTEDFLIQDNRNFGDILFKKKIPHEIRFLPGEHNWKFWDHSIEEFLQLSNSRLVSKTAKAS